MRCNLFGLFSVVFFVNDVEIIYIIWYFILMFCLWILIYFMNFKERYLYIIMWEDCIFSVMFVFLFGILLYRVGVSVLIFFLLYCK